MANLEGWIKLYRKSMANLVFRKDRTAWHVFETLLLNCDKTGKWSGGRNQLAMLADEKPVTTYKALRRLNTASMLTLTSNNRFTAIQVANWPIYQGAGNSTGNNAGNNAVTTEEHSYKNKEYIIKENIKRKEFQKPSLLEVENYIKENNYPVDPERWHAHYSAKDWMIGKNKMKDWHAAVRTWLPNGWKRPEKSKIAQLLP